MDNDGRLDVVCRHLGRRRVRVCLQNGDGSWTIRSFDVRDREGLKLADLDRDGVMDIVMNGFWWAGPKSGSRRGDYTEFTIDAGFFSPKAQRLNNSTKNGIGDFNGDGRVDVGLVSAEGNKVCLAVYMAPLNPREEKWQKIVVKEDFGNCHQLEVADEHKATSGMWPTLTSGTIAGTEKETWSMVDAALRQGQRGLPGGSSLAQLLEEHRGVRNPQNLPPFTVEKILEWADEYKGSHGGATRSVGEVRHGDR